MDISLDKIKELREKTAVSIAQCKAALEEANGDIEKAVIILRKKGLETADRKSKKETHEGIISYYVHSNNKVGAMIELLCETDFVARNEAFIELGRNLAMQVVAANPRAISPDEISEEEIEAEKNIYKQQLIDAGKPADIVEKAISGKVNKYKQENSLLTQAYIKDPSITVEELVKNVVAKVGENIQIGKFCRFQI